MRQSSHHFVKSGTYLQAFLINFKRGSSNSTFPVVVIFITRLINSLSWVSSMVYQEKIYRWDITHNKVKENKRWYPTPFIFWRTYRGHEFSPSFLHGFDFIFFLSGDKKLYKCNLLSWAVTFEWSWHWSLFFEKFKKKFKKFCVCLLFFCVKMFKASAHNFKAYDEIHFFLFLWNF